jgi:hypothetical protein
LVLVTGPLLPVTTDDPCSTCWSSLGSPSWGEWGPVGGPPRGGDERCPPRSLVQPNRVGKLRLRHDHLGSKLSHSSMWEPACRACPGPRHPLVPPPGAFLLPCGAPRWSHLDRDPSSLIYIPPGMQAAVLPRGPLVRQVQATVPHFTPPGIAAPSLPERPTAVGSTDARPSGRRPIHRPTAVLAVRRPLPKPSPAPGFEPASPQGPSMTTGSARLVTSTPAWVTAGRYPGRWW